MTHLTIADETSTRPTLGLRRAAALTAIVAFGLLVPATAGASPAAPPPVDGDLSSNPGCEPDLPCDIDPEPDECDPLTEICDFTSGGDGPDDPCEADVPPAACEPPEEPDVDPQVTPNVDVPVRATPNFTG